MEVAEAFGLIAHAIDSGHPAHGYLIVGDLKGGCADLTDRVLAKLFPDAAAQLASRSHPDVVYLEPQGKSRTIKVQGDRGDDGPGMRDGLVEPMSLAAFSGGWKVGVIVGADRLQPAAANAFLKSLEEPPPRTMYLMLTDRPDAILPTIVSRSQRINLPLPEDRLEDEARARVEAAFYAKDATVLAEALADFKADAEDCDVPQVRKRFYKTIMGFVREMMLSGDVPRHLAYRNVEAVEDAYRRSEKSMPDESVLAFMLDQVTFSKAES